MINFPEINISTAKLTGSKQTSMTNMAANSESSIIQGFNPLNNNNRIIYWQEEYWICLNIRSVNVYTHLISIRTSFGFIGLFPVHDRCPRGHVLQLRCKYPKKINTILPHFTLGC